MRPEVHRVQLSIRLDRADKAFLTEATERCGLEPSVAARQILELLVQRMRAGASYIDAVHELNGIWRQQAALPAALNDCTSKAGMETKE